MNIAIGLYGHFRTFPIAISSWEPFYKKYNPDVFVHSWSTIGYKSSESPIGTISQNEEHSSINEDSFYNILGHHIQNIVIEDYELYKDTFNKDITPIVEYQSTCPREHRGINVHGRYAQAYKVEQADKLRQQSNKHYDIVILTRPDIVIGNPTIELNIMNDDYFAIDINGPRMVNDLIRYSSASTMTIASSLYTHYHIMFNRGVSNGDLHTCFDTHGMLYSFLAEYNGLNIIPTNISVTMKR